MEFQGIPGNCKELQGISGPTRFQGKGMHEIDEEPHFGLMIAPKVTEMDKMLNLGNFLSTYRTPY